MARCECGNWKTAAAKRCSKCAGKTMSEVRLGSTHTTATKEKIRLGLQKFYDVPEHRVALMYPRSEETRLEMSRARSRYLATGRAYNSKLEQRAALLLKGFKHRFLLSKHVFDFVNKEDRIVVEINGCYWHNHDCGAVISGFPTRDRLAKRIAKKHGYRLLVLWECEERKWPKLVRQFCG